MGDYMGIFLFALLGWYIVKTQKLSGGKWVYRIFPKSERGWIFEVSDKDTGQ